MAWGHLADRLRGGGASHGLAGRASGPCQSAGAARKLQQRLARSASTPGTGDGKLGAGTREALQRFQARAGMPADGFRQPPCSSGCAAAADGGTDSALNPRALPGSRPITCPHFGARCYNCTSC